MDLGIYTFGDIVPDPFSRVPLAPAQRMAQMLDMARQADALGLRVFGVGEHHTLTYVATATATVLSAVAAVTKTIRLTSASTLLATADPVRTFEEFATVDLISSGRAEIVAGRGAFTENFGLFGFDLQKYDPLFAEKLDLLLKLNASERITWRGQFRPALSDAEVAPRPAQAAIPVWAGALSPASMQRAARLGLPLAMPMLGGTIAGYAGLARQYRQVWAEAGHDPAACRIAGFAHCHVAATSQAARDEFYPYYTAYFAHLSGRGGLPRPGFDQMCAPDGALVLGSPQEVTDRLSRMREAIGLDRFVGQIDVGGQPWVRLENAIDLFATKVAPTVQKPLGVA